MSSHTNWATLIENTRRHLMGQQRSAYNRLSGIHTATRTTLTMVNTLDGIARGNVLSVNDELVFIISTDAALKTVEVIRGFWDTSAVIHADASLVEINPRFPTALIRKELVTEIQSWAPDLFASASTLVAVGATKRAVDLSTINANWLHLLRVLRQPVTPTSNDSWVEVSPCRMERGLPLGSISAGSTGDALDLEDGTYDIITEAGDELLTETSISEAALFLPRAFGTAHNVWVTYATDFDLSHTNDTDLLIDNLVEPFMYDVAEYGAAWRLIVGREVRRTFTEGQGEPRNAAEVPPGAVIASARAMKGLRDERMQKCIERLHHYWGIKVTG